MIKQEILRISCYFFVGNPLLFEFFGL